MAHPPETRTRLRAFFIHDGLSLDTAAERLSLSSRTATRWKQEALAKGDDWDKARAASRLAGEGAEAVSQAVLEEFLALFQTTLGEIKGNRDLKPMERAEAISRLSDAYTKTMSSVAKSAPKLNRLAVASEVLQLLAKFVQTKVPKHAPALMEVLEPFGEELVAAYG
jgi:predicted ArsR family transcriptional regulator